MPTQLEMLQEAARRGILPADKRPLYDEAVRRGLIQGDTPAAAPQTPPMPQPDLSLATPLQSTMGIAGPSGPLGDINAGEAIKPFAAMTEPPGANIPLQPAHMTQQEIRQGAEAEALRPTYPETAALTALMTAGAGPAIMAGLSEPALSSISDEIHGQIENPIAATVLDVGVGLLTGLATDKVGKTVYKWATTPTTMTRHAARKINQYNREFGQTVRKGIEKGIRPTVKNVTDAGMRRRYFNNAQTAVDTIIANRKNLALVDEAGEIVTDTLPKNLQQFTDAIEQTKHQLFTEYNQLATQAGKQGAKVKLVSIADELKPIMENNVLQDLAPDAVEYARTRSAILTQRQYYTAQDAQDAIRFFNNSLKSFYKNPSPDTASKAYIDSLIVNKLRKGLDDIIEKTVEPGYQELKNAYGSLKTIERDANRRMIVDARKNPKGLLDFSDIFSGERAVRGILTANPAAVGEAAAIKSITEYLKWKNNPNKIIENMFKDAENIRLQQIRLAGNKGTRSVINPPANISDIRIR